MRSGYGMLYMPEDTARSKCGGLPSKPQAFMAGQPLYSAKSLRPVLADNFHTGKVSRAQYNTFMDWFGKVIGDYERAQTSIQHL